MTLLCNSFGIFFSGLTTNFIKNHPFSSDYAALAFHNHWADMSVKSFNQFYYMYVLSTLTDIVFYSGGNYILLFTNTKSMYRTTVSANNVYVTCLAIDFNPSILIQATTNMN